VWKYLNSHGSTAIGVSVLILLSFLIILLMCFPLQITLVPRLLPLSPRVKEPEKRPLKIREYAPGLWATGGTPEDKAKTENGVLNTDKPIIEKDKQ
jgi:hypothetical protein